MRLTDDVGWIGTRRTAWYVPLGCLLVVLAAEGLAILLLNGGHLGYTLDDAYIHLALAENIIGGHYGVNPGVPSAPASSILWPFLLAPLARTGVGLYVPLVLNAAAAVGVVQVGYKLLQHTFGGMDLPDRSAAVALCGVLLIPMLNLGALVYMGMEHTLQLYLSMLLVWGIMREQLSNRVPPWFVLVAVAGPMVRYENLALSLPALVYLAWRGHARAAFGCGLGMAATLGGFSAFLNALGLGWLPTSILVKVPVMEGGGGLSAVLATLNHNVTTRQGALLGLACVALVGLVLAGDRREIEERSLAAWAVLCVVLHLIAGRFGGYERYEVYCWGVVCFVLLYVFRKNVLAWWWRSPVLRVLVVAPLFVAITAKPYAVKLLTTPIAANNIYEQQYQMHRFVAEYYRAPVAVNDLGWVSYRNRRYVLDLWGLASKEALAARRSATAPDWMEGLAEIHAVRLAMIYDDWFDGVPGQWRRIGRLHLGRRRVTPAGSAVTFYALDATVEREARALIEEFRQTLPGRARFVFEDEEAPASDRAE